MYRTWLAIVLMHFSATALAGDVYVKAKMHTDAMQMRGTTVPAKDEVIEQWIGDGKMYHGGANSNVIVDNEAKRIFFLSPKSKSYVEAALPLDFAKLLPEQLAAMAAMMKTTVTVTASAETKKIGSWNCRGYDMTITAMGMPMKTRIWATKDVPIDLSKYREMYTGILKSQFMDEAAIKEMSKIDGFHIQSETNAEMMGAKIHSTLEVVEIAQKSAPPGTYSVPAGFAKRDRLSAEDLQR